jgi:hypothetical protein
VDLERLKDDSRWLSDSHVTFALRWVLFSTSEVHLTTPRDCFCDVSIANVRGNLNIELLDTTFWQRLHENPEKYGEKQRKRENLLERDFAVMPMFGG